MHNVEVWGKWVWEEAGRRQYGFMHNIEVWEMGGCPLTLRRRTTSKGTEAEEELVGDIMALCIMSKCGGNECVAVG